MLQPNRNFDSQEYRYGFQGQEKDSELKGEGNSVNYKYRMHDPRLGRFFAVDPLTAKYPYYSSYQFSGNRLIDMVELEGLEPEDAPYKNKEGTVQSAPDRVRIKKKDYGLTELFEVLSTDWYWHNGQPKTGQGRGWYKKGEFDAIISGYAHDYALSKGNGYGTDWQSAKQILLEGTEPSDLGQETVDYLDRNLSEGFEIYLQNLGDGMINSSNIALWNMARGVITPMESDSPFFVISGFSKMFLTKSATKQLQGYANKAIKQVDGLGDEAFSAAQLAAIEKYPHMRPMFRGYNIDRLTREMISANPKLKPLLGKINKGPDFIDETTGQWWDMTTKAQWEKHFEKYMEQYGTNAERIKVD